MSTIERPICPVCKQGRLCAAQEGSRHFILCVACGREASMIEADTEHMKPIVETAWQHDHEQPVFKSEKQFMKAVMLHAKANGWLVYHTHDSRRCEPGFPDLIMCRQTDREGEPFIGQTIYAELKMPKGKVSDAQQKWIDALDMAGNDVFVWRPSDWNIIMEVLGA